MNRRYAPSPIGRAEFLEARMAYLATLRDEGESFADMMRACNLGDEGQARLLLMTWDESVPCKNPPSAEYVEELESCNKALAKNLGELLDALPRCHKSIGAWKCPEPAVCVASNDALYCDGCRPESGADLEYANVVRRTS